MTQHFRWQNHTIDLRYSQRKSIALHVDKGRIEVRAPIKTPTTFILKFLTQKEQWLQKTLQHQQSIAKDQIDYRYAAKIPFMGINVALIRNKSKTKNHWSLIEQGLAVYLTNPEDGDALLNLLEAFYKSQAQFWLRQKTEQIARKAGLQNKLTDIRLRRTKTKWGHCTTQGRIQYNWQIMMAPEKIIDYLVAHEVSHLRYMNHSEHFWQHVEQMHPSYKADKKWLHDNGHRLKLRE